MPWGTGATGPAAIDYICASSDDADGNTPTADFGHSGDPDGDFGPVCKEIYCSDGANGQGYCTRLCTQDSDSEAVANMDCVEVPFIERANPADTVSIGTCTKQ
jgi:hypothetical protein